MKFEPRKKEDVNLTFALLPVYCGDIEKFVWLEPVWKYFTRTNRFGHRFYNYAKKESSAIFMYEQWQKPWYEILREGNRQ